MSRPTSTEFPPHADGVLMLVVVIPILPL